MNIVRPDAFCEALFAPQGMAFRGGENVYTEDVGGSSPSSPTIFSITYGSFAKSAAGSLNLAHRWPSCYLGSMNRTKGESMAILNSATRKFMDEAMATETDACIIWPYSLEGGGYAQASDANGPYKPHRRACEIAHGPPPSPKHHAAHLCGNRPCINKRHLVWATPKENEGHKNLVHGTIRRSAQRTLTDDQVRDIRRRVGDGEQMIVLAAEYGISNVAISKIVKWRSYRDVAA